MVRQEPAVTAFTLGPAQRALAQEVRQLTASELRPIAEAGEPGRVNRELIRAMGRLGLLSRLFPGEKTTRGTRTVPAVELCLLWEALATESTDAALALALQGIGTYPVLWSGPSEQLQRWLSAAAAGDSVAGLALTDPGAQPGAGEAGAALTAEPDGDGWRLTGEKTWVYNAPEADFYTVFARTVPGTGMTAFLVPAIRPGLTGESMDVVTRHPVGSLTFDGVPVCPDDQLGEAGHGHEIAASTMAAFQPSLGAFTLGMAQAALDHAMAQAAAQLPSTGGHPASHLLAEMITRTRAARLLVYAAAAAGDAGEDPGGGQAAMALLYGAETAQFVVDGAMQLRGRDSLRRGHLLEQLSCEVRTARLYQSTPEVQQAIIAGQLPG